MNNNFELDNLKGQFYGGKPLDDMNEMNEMNGGSDNALASFSDFLRLNNKETFNGGNPNIFETDNQEMNGGVRRKKNALKGENVEVEIREGYDSFTVVKTNVGEPGGRYISKTPNGAASKVASRLLREANKSSVKFVIQKTTRGSNHRYYAYEASVTKLSSPVMVFKKDEQGNKIVMNKSGQVLRVKNDKVINVSGKTKPNYEPDAKVSNVQSFDYKPYLIKEVTKKVNVKSVEVPDELKQKYMEAKKGKKDASKVAEKKAKKAEKKEAEKATKKPKTEKKPKATKPKAEKKPKATKPKTEKKPKGAKKGAKKMSGGAFGSCSSGNSCF